MPKIFIIEKLSLWSLPWALFYKLKGYQIFNLAVANYLKQFFAELDLSTIQNCDAYVVYNAKRELSDKIWRVLSRKNNYIERFFLRFNVNHRNYKVLLLDAFDRVFSSNVVETVLVSRACTVNSRVVVFGKWSHIFYSLLGNEYSQYINAKITGTSIARFSKILFITTMFARLLSSGFLLLFKNIFFRQHRKHEVALSSNNLSEKDFNNMQVLFFPHKGVKYADLFVKDTLYSSDKNSSFYPKNMIHLEYNLMSERDSVLSNYIADGLKYFVLPKFTLHSLFSVFFKKIECISYLRYCTSNNLWGVFANTLSLLEFLHYRQILSRFKSAKLAYVEWDALFPRHLSVALKSLSVVLVAFQARPWLIYGKDHQNMSFDHYFVTGQSIKDTLENSRYGEFGNIIPLAPPRSHLLVGYLHQREQIRAAEFENIGDHAKIIVCYDYNLDDKEAQKKNAFVNWENNQVFYEDIFLLAEKFENHLFVIRCFDGKWCNNSYFSDIYQKILKQSNIIIDCNYSQPQRSYMLAAIADLIIAKPTSIADEALALGIPVLLHDYAKNHQSMVSRVFSYKGCQLYVHSRQQLQGRVNEFISNTQLLSDSESQYLRGYVYNNAASVDTKKVLHNRLHKIINQRAIEKKESI